MFRYVHEARSFCTNLNAYLKRSLPIALKPDCFIPIMNIPFNALSTDSSAQDLAQFPSPSLHPPAEVRGMKSLVREQFSKSILVPILEVDVSKVTILAKNGLLKKYLLKLMNFRPVQDSRPIITDSDMGLDLGLPSVPTSSTKKVVHLNPFLIKSYNDLDEHDREVMKSIGITQQALQFVNLTLTYENWRADEILKAILPEDKDNVTSFSKIGHIIHLNLRDHVMEYKHIIGQVLLDKVSGAKTVVNKINSISNTYRNFKMEIICGENNMMTQVRENSCIYEFDFSLVYWNPRLCTEHERIAKKVHEGDVLYDVFAGVGPFAIPACKKKCSVLANDLNPESYKWLQHNGKLNKVLTFLKTFNKDGSDFLKEDVKSDMLQRWKDTNHEDKFMHITMNLPAIAETFLYVFNGLFLPEEIRNVAAKNFPIVHLYCFTKGEGDPVKLALNKVEENLGSKLDEKDILEIIHVRSVSSYKEMMRVSFNLSMNILARSPNTKKRQKEEESSSPQLKKINYDNHGEKVTVP